MKDQVAIITGASSGIGWGLALALAGEGCKVGLVARRRDKLEELAGLIRQRGGVAELVAADVGAWTEVKGAVDQLRAKLGPIDLMIANAGVGKPTILDPVNLADIEEMFRVNLMGMIYSISAVLPEMLQRGRGHLSAIASLAAYKGLPGESAYCASKSAVNTYLEGLRIQLRSRGIAVTTVNPGFVTTPMIADNDFPMPGIMDTDAAARIIVRGLRRRAKVLDFPWQTRFLTWLARRLPDWLVAWSMKGYEQQMKTLKSEVQ